MDEQQAEELLKKYTEGTANPEERAQVEAYYFRFLKGKNASPDHGRLLKDQADVRAHLQAHINMNHVRSKRWPRIAAAAVIMIGLSYGGYTLLHQTPKTQIAQNQPHDIAPGHNQATLTLSNGQKIVLIKGLNGKLAQQGNASVVVNSGNAITYTPTAETAAAVTYNTMSTTRGEQSPYPLILADGTKVWLDAASSVTYPTEFTGKERLVQITGQAYFEVAHNATQPFRISVRNITIEDIGTAFNINAYEDEPVIKTTLLQGAVKVTRNNLSVFPKPGQEAIAGSSLFVKEADIEESTAWKNGDFNFDDEKIEPVMRQLARWYNIDVQYDGNPPSIGFNAEISRYKNISQVLKVLALTKRVHFKVEGRRVMVTE